MVAALGEKRERRVRLVRLLLAKTRRGPAGQAKSNSAGNEREGRRGHLPQSPAQLSERTVHP